MPLTSISVAHHISFPVLPEFLMLAGSCRNPHDATGPNRAKQVSKEAEEQDK